MERKELTQNSLRALRTVRRELGTLGRKSPPFANGAKDGAPSSSFVWNKQQGIEEHRQECLCHKEERQELEAEDLEVALAGEDYGEEAAVGGEGVFADGQAVEEHAGFGFEDRDIGVGRVGAEFGDTEGDEVGGFFFEGAL